MPCAEGQNEQPQTWHDGAAPVRLPDVCVIGTSSNGAYQTRRDAVASTVEAVGFGSVHCFSMPALILSRRG